mmetsp:Transcript_30713/g.69984  ORF Transcript_30713/g.69984 Transcript_30713/m.69984 type:complete len:212 (+) Transcript_30713:58-693(+)
MSKQRPASPMGYTPCPLAPTSVLLLALRLLGVADLLVDRTHVGVRDGSEERVLASVARHGEDPHPRAAVDRLPVGAVAEGVVVGPVRLVVDHAPLVLRDHVAQAMVVEGQRVRPLPVAVRERLPHLLVASVEVRVEEPMASEDPDHGAHCHGGDPPVVVGGRIADPRMQPLLVEEVRDGRVGLVLQEQGVALAEGEGGEVSDRRVRGEVLR